MLTQTVECEITNPTDLETERLLTVTVHLGNQLEPVGMIRINEPLNLLVILIPIFAGMHDLPQWGYLCYGSCHALPEDTTEGTGKRQAFVYSSANGAPGD